MDKTRQKKEKDVLDQLLDNIDFWGLIQDEVVGKDGLIKQLTGRILQRALEAAEMTEHLGYEKNSSVGDNSGNSWNGHGEKTVLLENQSATISAPFLADALLSKKIAKGAADSIILMRNPSRHRRIPPFFSKIQVLLRRLLAFFLPLFEVSANPLLVCCQLDKNLPRKYTCIIYSSACLYDRVQKNREWWHETNGRNQKAIWRERRNASDERTVRQ